MTRLEQAITIRARNELDPCFDSITRHQFLKMKARLFSFRDINDGLDERETPWCGTWKRFSPSLLCDIRWPYCWDRGFEGLEKEGEPEL